MNSFRADLHCHTTCSDGTLTPEQVIDLAKASGLTGLSITDHDAVEAYPTAIPYAEKIGIILLTGVEFSATHKGHSVHILGYGFDPKSHSIAEMCKRHTQRRSDRNLAMLKKLTKHAMPLDEADLLQVTMQGLHHTIGRPHIALAMIKKGYVSSVQEAFNKYLGEDKSCYVQGNPISVEETLEAIHQGGGIAVMAHPHLIKNDQLVRDLLKQPFDGLECYYGNFYADAHQRWLKLAKQHNLLVTGGSDFHGDIKPNLALGSSWIDETLFNLLRDKIHRRC